ncbi:MAG TPA: malonyl-CoA decarboxylase [Acidocella sp.]|uniref:malonyl-CoA decarboxylase n=1 Tax=Acidocella sp. TaxID=50710 RepID=UPI002C693BD9|nr:malonyl-CoA decarboxylase [Acidocella sp.]HVE21912.1 malonyl-CoA decarboxylase [Acidocella sp.]
MPDVQVTVPPAKPEAKAIFARSWIERLGMNRVWASIADRGRRFALLPATSIGPAERARLLAETLISNRGEASGAAVARELHGVLSTLDAAQRLEFYRFLATNFAPEPARLAAAAQAYLAEATARTAADLADAAEPVRQELLRRMNMSRGGTAMLVAMRKEILSLAKAHPELLPLETDLLHLLASWFNRGFLEMRRIDWNTPAAVLDKLIAYEAVHEIQGWDDLRRRLASDRRCFGFFHPALPGEPLIFVEVALVTGLAGEVRSLLARDTDEEEQRLSAAQADTAIFYSISNCQDGLRGVSFGNFLIKQVVEELRTELPQLVRFSTLSPVPGFASWLAKHGSDESLLANALWPADRAALALPKWWDGPAAAALQAPLLRLCAAYLTSVRKGRGAQDPVARFHLGNGARLERINWMGNSEPRGLKESYGIMVNYLYDIATIEANHEAYAREQVIARSEEVEALLHEPAPPKRRRFPALRAGER